MLDNIKSGIAVFLGAPEDIILWGIIAVSVIIFLLGIVKHYGFNKIKNDEVRGTVTAFSSIIACFVAVLLRFLINGYTFEHYLLASVCLSFSCIVVYFLYEFTRLRKFIHVVGKFALKKIFKTALSAEDLESLKVELKGAGNEIKAYTKKELKKATAKEDKDLRSL